MLTRLAAAGRALQHKHVAWRAREDGLETLHLLHAVEYGVASLRRACDEPATQRRQTDHHQRSRALRRTRVTAQALARLSHAAESTARDGGARSPVARPLTPGEELRRAAPGAAAVVSGATPHLFGRLSALELAARAQSAVAPADAGHCAGQQGWQGARQLIRRRSANAA